VKSRVNQTGVAFFMGKNKAARLKAIKFARSMMANGSANAGRDMRLACH
jgi:hypothetical protein